MSEGRIQVLGMSISYDTQRVLDHVDFQCDNGEFVAIVGESGTGKSSFLNALAGFIPYDGRIDISKSVGYVFQSYALFPWMTVAGNIRFGLAKLSRREQKERTKRMLERIEMLDLLKRYPSQLSGGQVQRVALARAIAPDPEVLMMDEPYGALDHHTRDKMQSWLLSVWGESRKTVLFVTHYIEEAIFLADRIVVLSKRKFVADIAVPFSRPRTNELRFTERFLDVKQSILSHMAG